VYSLTGQAATLRGPAQTVSDMPEIFTQQMSFTRILHLNAWHQSSRYERHQTFLLSKPTSPTSTKSLQFHCTNFSTGGGTPALKGTNYQLLVDGVSMCTATVTPNVTVTGTFLLPTGQIATGWHELDILSDVGALDGPTPKFFIYVHRPADNHVPLLMPVCFGSYEISKNHQPHRWAWVPTSFNPVEIPIEPRECPVFDTPIHYSQLFRENYSMKRSSHDADESDLSDTGAAGVPKRPNINKDGIWNTFNIQFYHFDTLIMKFPRIPLLDGPRGRGTSGMLTHIQVDRHGGAYCTDPWRVIRIDQTGKITTRAGYRHNPVGGYHEEAETGSLLADQITMELVGDWSAIPVARHGFREMWGLAFDLNSLALDPTAPPQFNSVNGEMEQPHLTDPRAFVSDTRNDRICLLTFKKDDFNAEPRVTEFIVGLVDPWDVVWVAPNSLYISEREANRIVEYNATTGVKIRDVLTRDEALISAGGSYAWIDSTSRFHVTTTPHGTDTAGQAQNLADRRMHDTMTPEGLFHQDGWLYYGSVSNRQVRRVNLASGVIEVVCFFYVDNNSRFCKFTVSDGTFGPRGTVFVNSWSINHHGYPEAKLPDGTNWVIETDGNLPRGPGGKWITMGYSAAAGVGNGRLFCAAAGDGITRLSKSLPTDLPYDEPKYNRGEQYFADQGYQLVLNIAGMGNHSFKLPWGENEDMDYYFEVWGHTKPVVAPPVQPFDAVTLLSTGASRPDAETPNMELQVILHGSGGDDAIIAGATTGEHWVATCGDYHSDVNGEPWRFIARDWASSTYVRVDPLAGAMMPDGVTGTGPAGGWMGWSKNGGTAYNYLHRRLTSMMAFIQTQYPYISLTKRTVHGGSMGAWCCLEWAIKHPEHFAAIFASRPRWRFGSSGTTVGISNRATGVADEYLPANAPPVDGFNGNLYKYKNAIDYVLDPAVKIPFIIWCVGRQDGYMVFQDHIDAVAAMRASGRPFAFAWNNGNHSSGDIMLSELASYTTPMFEIGKGVLHLTNCSNDQNPAVDLVGSINKGFRWRNIVNTANLWSCEMYNNLACTVTAVPYGSDVFDATGVSPKTVTLVAATWTPISFTN
jgi:hypothetical protein